MIVTASKKAWDEEQHHALLQKVNPAVGVDTLAGLVQRGLISLFEVHADGVLLGIFISRTDRLFNGDSELVIMHAAAVQRPPFPMTSILNPVFDQVAKDHGLRAVRVHSDKKGLDKLLEAHGYEFQEAVYRKVI